MTKFYSEWVWVEINKFIFFYLKKTNPNKFVKPTLKNFYPPHSNQTFITYPWQ